jgi:fructosamine-3-kinase
MINPAFLSHLEHKLRDLYAKDLIVVDCSPLGGGDINATYKLSLSSGEVFLKINDALRFPGLFEGEKKGLELLIEKSRFLVPKPIDRGVFENKSYLLLEYITLEGSGNWSLFGKSLAKMHRESQQHFGLDHDNYIGSLVQENSFRDTWADFYAELRLYPLMKRIIEKGLLSLSDGVHLDGLVKELASIYPDEKPALLHGDLWSGNAAFSASLPCIYDPAVYYGHREMDIAMTFLFGGFPSEMMAAYTSLYPLEKGWRERLEISQLYPLMVHSLLFGSSYARQVKEILKRF